MTQLALPLDPLAGLVDPLSTPRAVLARRPDLAAAAARWNRGPTEVAGISINDRVAFFIEPGIWRYGRVISWEPIKGISYPLAQIAVVSVERREATDPHEVRRVRAGLTTISERA